MGFPIQEYWSGLSFPSPRDLPKPGIKPMFPALAGRFFASESPGKYIYMNVIVVQSPSCVRIFTNSWTATHQSSLYLTNSWNLPIFMSIESVMPSSYLSSSDPVFSFCTQSFPPSGSFQLNQLTKILALRHQPFQWIFSLFPLRFTSLTSLLSKELSGVFSSTRVWRH